MRDILETSAAKKDGSAIEKKIGDYYMACLDEKAIEAKGIAPLKPELDRIAAIKDQSGAGRCPCANTPDGSKPALQRLFARGLE